MRLQLLDQQLMGYLVAAISKRPGVVVGARVIAKIN